MQLCSPRFSRVATAVAIALAGFCAAGAASAASAVATVAGMPPVVNPDNLYSEAGAGHMSPAVAGALPRVYVPNLRSNDVYVIDPATLKVVDRFHVGFSPQHVVPAWDLQTLWVANNAEGRPDGSLTPIDPKTGKPGKQIMVDDPYNMYFTPDGKYALVMAEREHRLDFRDAQTMKVVKRLPIVCEGVNHIDYSIDGHYFLATCEFSGELLKVDVAEQKVVGKLKLTPVGMPQDCKLSPDGKVFYVANMEANGVHLIDGDSFKQLGFLPTGKGTHGLYVSRDSKYLYVSNRGEGTVSLVSFATRKVVTKWVIPGGGSPDMGGVSADGKVLWLSGRYHNVVYAFDTSNGNLIAKIPVGKNPHGLCVYPQPGRYSLGHTGVFR
jgi:YVTN family beta-propeller protein